MSRLPSRRLLLLAAAAAPLFFVADAVALAADGLLLAAAVADAVLAPGPDAIRVRRHVPAQLGLGEASDVTLEVANRSPRPVRVRVTDDLPPGLERGDGGPADGPAEGGDGAGVAGAAGRSSGGDVMECRVPAGGRATVGYRLRGEERGTAAVGDVHLRALGPLGLVWRQWRLSRADEVRVRPGLLAVRRYRLLALRNRLGAMGVHPTATRGEGRSFESLREYVRGDDPRRIDWKATARRGEVIVREYEAERSQSVVLAVDAGRLMSERAGGRERLDHALSAALLLAEVAFSQGDRVGALVFADRVQHFVPPARDQRSRLAEVLAETETRIVEPDYPSAFEYLGRQLRRRSLVVVFTDVVDVETSGALLTHLAAAGRRHVPLAVALGNPELDARAESAAGDESEVFDRAAAEELIQARARALASMRRAGVLVADARPDDAAPEVVNRYLRVKRRGRL